MKTVVIPHPTNLGQPWIITIGPAPATTVPETQLPATFALQCGDATGHYQLQTFSRLRLHDLFDTITWAAAGMDAITFCRHWYEQYPTTAVNPTVAVYNWKKI